MATVIPILIFILILSVVIFIHELGHFWAARRAGIFVEEFALGMGPKIISKKGKKAGYPGAGEDEVTLYSLRLFPIGGFCKMRGQDEDFSDAPGSINTKSVPARFFVIAGGSLMNFALAFVLFFVLVMLRGFMVPEVVTVSENSPGYHAGLMPGDRITHIDGQRVSLYDDFIFMLDTSGGEEMDVRVNRGGERVDLSITPAWDGQRYVIGFMPGRRFGVIHEEPAESAIPFRRVSVPEGIANAAEMIGFHIRTPFRLVAGLFGGRSMPEEAGGLMGPIGIGGLITEVYQETIAFGALNTLLTMLFFAALLNAALGVMNLLPIPALDGARLVFLVIEGIRRKPIPPEREAMVHFVGLVALLLLAVFIAYRDIVRLI